MNRTVANLQRGYGATRKAQRVNIANYKITEMVTLGFTKSMIQNAANQMQIHMRHAWIFTRARQQMASTGTYA